ncbi:hypothetical protein BJ165DRAFT_1463427 [Panaeolus papilionaceus]|nr:hypothetical protein BJ165DRAFT_1463427 [Panaeolus papilionaceus]
MNVVELMQPESPVDSSEDKSNDEQALHFAMDIDPDTDLARWDERIRGVFPGTSGNPGREQVSIEGDQSPFSSVEYPMQLIARDNSKEVKTPATNQESSLSQPAEPFEGDGGGIDQPSLVATGRMTLSGPTFITTHTHQIRDKEIVYNVNIQQPPMGASGGQMSPNSSQKVVYNLNFPAINPPTDTPGENFSGQNMYTVQNIFYNVNISGTLFLS